MHYDKNKKLNTMLLICIFYFSIIFITNCSFPSNGGLLKKEWRQYFLSSGRIAPDTIHRLQKKKMAISLLNKNNIQLFKVDKIMLDQRFITVNNINREKPPIDYITPETIPAVYQQNKVVFLTFDDGPNHTSIELMSILDRYQVKATFFMLDGNIERYPEVINKMISCGHSVGLHGVSHDRSRFYQSTQTVLSEMDQTRNTIIEISGFETHLIRTPFGSAPDMTEEYKKAVLDHGYLLWDWNIDSKDWYYRDHRYVDNVIEQVEKQESQNSPLVILLHEREETVAQLPDLLTYLSNKHYIFKAIDPSIQPIHF